MPHPRRTVLQLMAGSLAATALGASAGQRHDSIRLVVTYQSAGLVDKLAREVAKQASILLKQDVVVENRTGAGGKLAMEHVAKAPPDGRTLLFTLGHALPSAQALNHRLPFDPRRDLTAVSEIAYHPGLLVAHHSLPVRTVRDLLLYARENLHSVRMGSWAPGSAPHIMQAYMSQQMGAPVAYVPYQGEAPILQDLLNGKLNLALLSSFLLKPHKQSNKIQVLAAMGPQRNPIFSEVPTMQELGYLQPLFQMEPPATVFAPSGIPNAELQRLGQAFYQATQTQEIQLLASKTGIRLIGNRPAEAQAHFKHYFPQVLELTELTGAQED